MIILVILFTLIIAAVVSLLLAFPVMWLFNYLSTAPELQPPASSRPPFTVGWVMGWATGILSGRRYR